jgi:excisionase family DNA binding protein
MNGRWPSVEEIAAHLGVNPGAIYTRIERMKVPAHKLGRLWKYLASEIDEWSKDGHAANDASAVPNGGTKKRTPSRS